MIARRRRQANAETSFSPKLLLVEGSGDGNVIQSLLKVEGLELDFRIEQQHGISGVINGIRGYWQRSGISALGMIVDADDDLNRQWAQIVRSLETEPVMRSLPSEPETGGTIVPGIPRLGIWVMPDNQSAGELEDFIFRMIPQPDPIWPRSEQYIDKIPESDRRFLSHKALRAKVHAWMATRSRPRPMWIGISEGDLELEENSRTFLDWLRRLFGDST